MTNYDKLVAALRYHADTTNCDACKLYDAGKCELKSCVLHDAADAIEKLVTLYEKAEMDATNLTGKLAQAEAQLPKHGEWIGIEYDGYADGNPVYDVWECSECGEEHEGEEDTLTNYCPNCGAKMEVQDGRCT